jgi:hypothetical protein
MFVNLSKISSGFSEKLRVVTYFIALILLLKKKKILNILDKKTIECPYYFNSHFNIKDFKSYNGNLKQKDNLIEMSTYNSFPNLKNCDFHNMFNLNNNKLIRQWKLSYKLLIPKENVKNKIKKFKLPKNYLSIHIRTTDRVIKFKSIFRKLNHKDMILKSQLNFFEHNIINFIEKYSKTKNIFISSDQETLKNKIIDKLLKNKFKVYYNKISYSNKFRSTSGDDFVLDLFCMAKSKLIFTTTGGGVPFTAKLISGQKLKIVSFINELNIYFILRLIFLFIYYLKRIKVKILFPNKV